MYFSSQTVDKLNCHHIQSSVMWLLWIWVRWDFLILSWGCRRVATREGPQCRQLRQQGDFSGLMLEAAYMQVQVTDTQAGVPPEILDPMKKYNIGPLLVTHVGYTAVTNHTCKTHLTTPNINNKCIFADWSLYYSLMLITLCIVYQHWVLV